MRRSLAPFSGQESLVHTRSLVDFITTMPALRFSVHTPPRSACAEFVAGFAGYYAVAAVWPNFYYTPIAAGKITWLGMQGICIAIYVAGVMAYGGIKRASHVLTARARPLSAS